MCLGLFRHASQSSLDESSQKLAPRAAEPRRPPYRNPSHPTKVNCQAAFQMSSAPEFCKFLRFFCRLWKVCRPWGRLASFVMSPLWQRIWRCISLAVFFWGIISPLTTKRCPLTRWCWRHALLTSMPCSPDSLNARAAEWHCRVLIQRHFRPLSTMFTPL